MGRARPTDPGSLRAEAGIPWCDATRAQKWSWRDFPGKSSKHFGSHLTGSLFYFLPFYLCCSCSLVLGIHLASSLGFSRIRTISAEQEKIIQVFVSIKCHLYLFQGDVYFKEQLKKIKKFRIQKNETVTVEWQSVRVMYSCRSHLLWLWWGFLEGCRKKQLGHCPPSCPSFAKNVGSLTNTSGLGFLFLFFFLRTWFQLP